MLQKKSKILLIATLNFLLVGCAGTAPKLERKISVYHGAPERVSLCRESTAQLVARVEKWAQNDFTRMNVRGVLQKALASSEPAALECIRADSREFATMLGLPADDMRVLLQYIENLLYSCERWKQ